ncbi:protein spinster homolog 3 isoform X2 [Ambystoma mexicanum]|uniref:protein spinster homolog 3 isoform X2 n=1 Tax=Ambystoma mexicanum TaxID=8296 RepID=UPI0037E77F12
MESGARGEKPSELTSLRFSRPGSPFYGATGSRPVKKAPAPAPHKTVSAGRAYGAVAVLCYVNLLLYTDWFIVAGVLQDITAYFDISDSNAGLLQTVFICCFLVAAPLFGYLGDRYSRKAIMVAGIVLWSGVTLGSSFITESYYWLFFLTRGLVGAGEASFSTIAPTIIGDLFVKDKRTRILGVFYVFIPAGSGLGYILGSSVAQATGDWRWALTITPGMAALALVLLILVVPDPVRGAADQVGGQSAAKTPWCDDVKSLCKNRSFVWSSLGVTAMAFVSGALGFWAPVFLTRARIVLGNSCIHDLCSNADSLIFGSLTVVTGILGVISGAEVARRYKKINPKADPLICAGGMLASSPCLFIAIVVAQRSILTAYIFIGLGELLLSLNWAIVADILLISDTIQDGRRDSQLRSFLSLEYSFMVCMFIGVLGGGCFLATSLYVEEDRKKAQYFIEGAAEKGCLRAGDDRSKCDVPEG